MIDKLYVDRMEQAMKHKKYFIDIIRKLHDSGTPQEVLQGVFELREPRRILDFGCGSGLLTYELAKAFPLTQVDGFDQSYYMVDVATERFRADNLFFTASSEMIERGAPYDYIILSSVLHEIYSINASFNDVGRFLDLLSGFLKEDGYIISRDNYLSPYGDKDMVLSITPPAYQDMKDFLGDLLGYVKNKFREDYLKIEWNDQLKQISGPEASIKELINKYTWGRNSLPREAKEKLFFFKVGDWSEILLKSQLNHVGSFIYKDNDYLRYLQDFCMISTEGFHTHIWTILQKRNI